MTVVDHNGFKLILARYGDDVFWTEVASKYAGESAERWRNLAILALRENAAWPLERISLAVGICGGQVSRMLTKVKAELRERFDEEYRAMIREYGFSDPRSDGEELAGTGMQRPAGAADRRDIKRGDATKTDDVPLKRGGRKKRVDGKGRGAE